MTILRPVLLLLIVHLWCAGADKPAPAGFVPKAGEFPPPGTGVYYAGELVSVDHVNRRGAIRLDGDGVDDRYHAAPSHRFAMLPYGTIRYRGAAADLRDLPIGTHVHGWFVLAPADDPSIPPPARDANYVPKETHVISLEDDPSFYARQGRAWRIDAIDAKKGTLTVAATGPELKHGLNGKHSFEIDRSTRIWRGRGVVELADLAAGQEVQLALDWAPEWKNGVFHCTDVWIDAEARALAEELQRRAHVRHRHQRWLPGWIDGVEHLPGGAGIVTVTLFAGADPSLYDEVRAHKDGYDLATADITLRTWWQEHDKKGGPRVALEQIPDPPPGSSGIRLKIRCDELLEGFRPARIVRVRPHSWPAPKLPPEERIKHPEDR
jgi:hypothetical protein